MYFIGNFFSASASSVLSNLDTTVNPCDDFYQFSCGNWIRKTVIPEEKSSKGVMSDLVDNIQLQVKGRKCRKNYIHSMRQTNTNFGI